MQEYEKKFKVPKIINGFRKAGLIAGGDDPSTSTSDDTSDSACAVDVSSDGEAMSLIVPSWKLFVSDTEMSDLKVFSATNGEN